MMYVYCLTVRAYLPFEDPEILNVVVDFDQEVMNTVEDRASGTTFIAVLLDTLRKQYPQYNNFIIMNAWRLH